MGAMLKSLTVETPYISRNTFFIMPGLLKFCKGGRKIKCPIIRHNPFGEADFPLKIGKKPVAGRVLPLLLANRPILIPLLTGVMPL
jgi:hypothetical protein